MVRDQRPGITWRTGLFQYVFKSFQYIFAILVIFENTTTFDSATDNVVHCPWGVYAGFSGHFYSVSELNEKINA
jgi:hypothetical protein